MHFVLCYPRLSDADAEAIEAFRRKHESARAKMVRAHVTLVFGVRAIAPDALTKLVGGIAAATAPFDFAVDGMEVEAHERGDHNLFLKIGKGSEALIALNRALYTGALAPERGDIAFSPHITVRHHRHFVTGRGSMLLRHRDAGDAGNRGEHRLCVRPHAVDFDVPIYNVWKQQEQTAGRTGATGGASMDR